MVWRLSTELSIMIAKDNGNMATNSYKKNLNGNGGKGARQ